MNECSTLVGLLAFIFVETRNKLEKVEKMPQNMLEKWQIMC